MYVCRVMYVTMYMYRTSQESAYSFQLWVKLSRTDDGYPLIGMAVSIICLDHVGVSIMYVCVYMCV